MRNQLQQNKVTLLPNHLKHPNPFHKNNNSPLKKQEKERVNE